MSGFREMHKPGVFCVLAMHRSGSSLLTRLLNLLGVYLGPEEGLAKPSNENPKGFWENTEIMLLNDELLTRLGGIWHEPPEFLSGWENDPALDDLKQRAQTLIQDRFADAEMWGWKDPRTCLTLPFWQQLLPPMRYVVCMRNPVDVSYSLELRNSFSLEKSSDLWLTYVNFALRYSDGHPRLTVFYEDIMEDWRKELRRLAEFLGRPERAEEVDLQDAVREFIENGLQHYRTSIPDTAANSRIAFQARTLYVAQRICVTLGRRDSYDQRESDKQLQQALDSLSRESTKARDQVNALLRQMDQREELLAERLNTIRTLEARLAELEKFARMSNSSLAGKEQVIAELSARVTQEEEAIERLQNEVKDRENQLRQIKGTLGWRILSLYGPIKYGFIKPLLRFFKSSGTD
jgi:hypothetical protein